MEDTKTIDFETLAQWSTAKLVATRIGPKLVRNAKPTDEFWSAWRDHKDALKGAGISLSKDRTGNWQASWWQDPSEEYAENRKAAIEASKAAVSDADIPAPEGLAYLPYQRAGIAYATSRSNVLIGDEMGLGKTIQAIGVANSDPTVKQVLIVCPSSLRLNWKREWKKWFIRESDVHVVEGGSASSWRNASCIIVNYDVLSKHRKRIDALKIDLLIADECHFCKNPKTIRSQALLGYRRENKDGISARRKVFLTGTPIANRPVEMWPLIESLDPLGMGSNFFGFAKRFCDAKKIDGYWDFSGASNLSMLQEELRAGFMIRRLKADVLKELPAKRRQIVEIPSDGVTAVMNREAGFVEQRDEVMADLEAKVELSKASENPEDYTNAVESLRAGTMAAFTEMAAIRHDTAVAKIPFVVEHLRSALDEGPVICFAHHKDVINAIVNEFPGSVKITGDVPLQERQNAVDAFQRGDSDLFVGNIHAAGVGITLTRSSHVVFAELDWVPGNVSQCEDRAHRIGQENSVLIQHLVFSDSLDAVMAKTLVRKQEVIDQALDKAASAITLAPRKAKVDKITVSKTDIDKESELITAEQVAAIHAGLVILSNYCDGAHSLDGMGFSKVDAKIGHSLARQATISKRQAVIGKTLVNKYRRQLPEDLVQTAKGAS